MKEKKKILVIDDDQSLCRVISYYLSEEGYIVEVCHEGNRGTGLFKKFEPDLLICDIKLPGRDGFFILEFVLSEKPDCPVIMITAHGTVEDAVKAMKMGACDYILKPFNKDELKMTVAKALQMSALVSENRYLRKELEDKYAFENIVGKSPEMEKVFRLISQVAPTDLNILILGESGTGKELVARAIHYNSPRKKKPFIAINASAIPENLMESELFGHKRGAFTGAVSDKKGKFQLAQGGTIFLDEIGDMKPELQVKLLRVIQEKEIDVVGGMEPVKIDVRLITATNKNLEEELEEGRFRDDLYYRLNVISIKLPPLRSRKSDIPFLVDFFLKKHCPEGRITGVSKEVMDVFEKYNWPGNVRELENVIERGIVLSTENVIPADCLPEKLLIPQEKMRKINIDWPEEGISLEEVEKELIKQALEEAENNQTHAAQLLSITRSALIYRMEKYGLK
ncbi:MAG: Transcriptional regulatory protein ZraR [bacterium ADurb.Bin363]|nr:MAG: Transcriptional regulatory protein ZraR [bacterium ADurb.Bin363]